MSELKPCPFCGRQPYESGGYVSCHTELCLANADYHEPTIGPITDWNTRPIEDALNARIAECESALISMVQQFFYNKDGEDAFRHSFMSAEEEAATYLVEHGIARWADKRKSSIYFNEVQVKPEDK